MKKIINKEYLSFCVGVSFLVSSSFFLFVVYYFLCIPGDLFFLKYISSHNLIIYALAIVCFSVSFIVLYFFLCRTECFYVIFNLINKLGKKYLNLIPVVVFVLFAAIWVEWGLHSQFTEAGLRCGTYNNYPMILKISFSLFVFIYILYRIKHNLDISLTSLYIGYVFSLIDVFLNLCIVNPFCCSISSKSFDVNTMFYMSAWDITSATETINNCLDFVPFTFSTSGIYGHYGLFFLPLKVFEILGRGRSPVYIALGIALVGLISQACIIYIIHSFAPNRLISLLLVIASVIRTTYLYYAINPIRIFCPALAAFYLTFCYRKHHNTVSLKSRWFWIGIVLCIIAFLWNMETGLACIAGFWVYNILQIFLKYMCYNKFVIFEFLQSILFLIFTVTVSIIIINIYNFLCGYDRIVVFDCFYPYIFSDFANVVINKNPLIGNYSWVHISILLLWCTSQGLLFVIFKDKSAFNPLFFSISVIAIVLFGYVFHECAWGSSEIVHQICFVLLIFCCKEKWYIISEKDTLNFLDSIKKGIIVFIIFVSAVLSAQIFNTPTRIYAKNIAGAYSLKDVESDIMENMLPYIPENTYGVGQMIHYLYDYLGWDNHAKMRDTSAIMVNPDVYSNAQQELVDAIIEKDSFVIGMDTDYDLDLLNRIQGQYNNFRLETVFTIKGCNYGYYKREK